MIGWRARIGILVPPGNPTVEPEMNALTPHGVSVHFSRMMASGETGSLEGQEERNREQLAGLDQTVGLLALVKPKVVVLAHTATSYTLGMDAERDLVARLEAKFGFRFLTAFGSVVAALRHLGVSRVALGTPYGYDTTVRGKTLLEAYGFEVPSFGNLPNVKNIYDETNERAYSVGRQVNRADAQAVFISGVGMPTIGAIESLECDLGKPVISAASAMMWHALRTAGVNAPVNGYGKLLRS
jgi:maleate cis-trans isomerase